MAALALRAVLSPDEKEGDDPERMIDGALLLAQLCLDIHILRIGIFKDG